MEQENSNSKKIIYILLILIAIILIIIIYFLFSPIKKETIIVKNVDYKFENNTLSNAVLDIQNTGKQAVNTSLSIQIILNGHTTSWNETINLKANEEKKTVGRGYFPTNKNDEFVIKINGKQAYTKKI